MIKVYEEFCSYLQDKKKASANTLYSYKRDIKCFIVFLQSKRVSEFNVIDNSVIDEYVLYLKNNGKSVSTVSRNLSSLRSFFKYLSLKKLVTFNPMVGIKNDKKESLDLPEVMSANDISTLLSSPDCSTAKGVRDKAMLETMYATGIRVSELLALKITDLNLEIGYILVNKGTAKERIVPLYPLAIEAIRSYISGARNEFVLSSKDQGVLFLNSTGCEMTRQGFWKIIKQYAKNTEIGDHITPKILRHSFATHLLENGADINLLKDMLGHTAISSTMVYAKVLKNKYMNVYENCHPRAKQM